MDLPKEDNVTPRYDQKTFPAEDRVNKLQTLVSPITDDDPGLKIHQDAWIYRTTLEAGKAVAHTLHSQQHGAYIFVIDGKVAVGEKSLGKKDALGISETDHFEIAASEKSDVLILEVPMYN